MARLIILGLLLVRHTSFIPPKPPVAKPIAVNNTVVRPASTNPCPIPKENYEDETDMNVGQNVSLKDETYTPDNLVKIDSKKSTYSICLKEEAANALEDLIEGAKADGMTLIVSSGFRDFKKQQSVMDQNIKEGNKNVMRTVAKPGYSEHQLGVAVDFTSRSINYAGATTRFGDTKESQWLETHASEYGFVESYPEGKEDITGYMYEPWHYRYVGPTAAVDILQNGLTVNQYLTEKINQIN